MTEKKSDGIKNTGAVDGADQKPGQETEPTQKPGSQVTQEDIDRAINKAMASGVNKGKKEATSEVLSALGVESLEELKTRFDAGRKAQETVEDTRTAAEKAIDELREAQEKKFKEYQASLDPVMQKAMTYIQEQEEQKLLTELKVTDREGFQAFSKLYPPEDGESPEDHAKRLIEKRPSLVAPVEVPNVPPSPNLSDPGGGKQDRMSTLAKEISAVWGGKKDWKTIVPKGG